MGCFCFGQKGPKVEIGSKGENIYRYPSGNVAAVIVGGTTSTFYEDSAAGKLLCNFNSQGVGKIYYTTGRLRVSVTTVDCTFFSPDGKVTKRWTWPRLLKQREEVPVAEGLHVTLVDRDSIVTKVRLLKNGGATQFESGRAAGKRWRQRNSA